MSDNAEIEELQSRVHERDLTINVLIEKIAEMKGIEKTLYKMVEGLRREAERARVEKK